MYLSAEDKKIDCKTALQKLKPSCYKMLKSIKEFGTGVGDKKKKMDNKVIESLKSTNEKIKKFDRENKTLEDVFKKKK